MAAADEREERKFCPKVEPTNNNMLDLPYNEKLNIVEREIQCLYEFCTERKFSKNEMFNCVSNLYGPKKSSTQRAFNDTARTFLVLSAIVGLIAILMVQPNIRSMAIIHAKLFSIKVILPYWDWAKLYEEDCIVANHWLPEKSLNVTSEQCKYCEMKEVEKLGNVTHSHVAAMLADNVDVPFVINDTADLNVEKITMEEIIYIYQHHSSLSSTLGSCTFQNNAGFNDMFYDFFNAYVDNMLPTQWHASWINCDTKAAKVVRKYHSRPYFLPPMMQLESENIVITSSGMNHGETFTLPNQIASTEKNEGGMSVTVISGSLTFTLKPEEQCMEKFRCKEVQVHLLPGETLFYLVESWETYYTSSDPGITIAIANSVVWDYM